MKASSGAAMALAVGYVLGRRHKLRTAVILCGVAASGRAGSLGAAAIKRGMNFAGTNNTLGKMTPQFGGLSSTVRDELLKAGRAAAVAVVNDRIESLSDSLHQRTESIRGPRSGDGDSESYEDEDEGQGEDGDYDEEDEPEDAYEDESEPELVEGPADTYEDDGYEDEDEDEVSELDDSLDNDVEDEEVNGSRRTRRDRSPASQSGR